jgi:hypothetical protein
LKSIASFILSLILSKQAAFQAGAHAPTKPRLSLKKNKAFFIFKKILAKATFLRW